MKKKQKSWRPGSKSHYPSYEKLDRSFASHG